jgi:hypothetical protein
MSDELIPMTTRARREVEQMIGHVPIQSQAPAGACALRGRRRLINLVWLIQFAVAVAATLISTANPRRLVRSSASML